MSKYGEYCLINWMLNIPSQFLNAHLIAIAESLLPLHAPYTHWYGQRLKPWENTGLASWDITQMLLCASLVEVESNLCA